MTSPKPVRYLDFHILQPVPPSNLNRDDNGSPKTARYGGVTRSRVSSQAWKRATRKVFADREVSASKATRTRRLLGLLTERIAERGNLAADEAEALAAKMMASLKIKAGKKAENLSYLLFFGESQIDAAVDAALALSHELGADSPELAKALESAGLREHLGTGHPADVALFGRMVADVADLNVDAAVQVAHALSTHAADTEFDYFTAVDDEQEDDETGAGMIGNVEFTSSTLYRFASLNVPQLRHNLDGDAEAVRAAVEHFARDFALSMPTGHLNSFGHSTRPAVIVVVARDDQPVNLVTAFERPVAAAQGGGFLAPSAAALANSLTSEAQRWGDAPIAVLATYGLDARGDDDEARALLESAFGESLTFERLLAEVVDHAVATRGGDDAQGAS